MMPDRSFTTFNEMDVFGQLKPIYGEAIDRYYVAYIAGTPRDKAEIIQFLQLLAIRVQKKRINDRKIYIEPPRPEVIGSGDYHLGDVVFPGKAPFPATLYRKECLRHMLFVGPSGSGKTTLILNIMQQLQADNVPWLALDWKKSFRVLMHDDHGQDVVVLTVGSDTAPLRLNMLLPPPGLSTASWVDNLTDTLCAGYSLLDGAQSALKGVFFDAINAKGKTATLHDALSFLRQRFVDLPAWRRRQLGWLESTERALVQLTTGTVGDCLNERDHPMLVGDLLDRQVVIELEGLGQAQGTTLSIFFMQCTLLTRQKQQGPRETLRHVTIIDEAQNIFRREAPWEKLSLPSRTIREVREYGECIIAATQQTDVSDSLIGNTGTKVVFRTNAKWDLDYFSKSFQVNPLSLTIIPNGQGIGVIPGRWPRPFLFSFKENKLKNSIVTDDKVRERYETWRNGKATTSSNARTERLSEKELLLLKDIATHPLLTITQHYDQLNWNPKTGNTIKESLLSRKLIDVRTIDRGRSRMKFLNLTTEGTNIMTTQGIRTAIVGPGSIEHEHWRSTIKNICEQHGYTVTTEYKIGNKRVDLHAIKEKTTFLIEIETGKSDVTANIEKCRDNGTLILFFTTQQAREAHQSSIPLTTIVITPETIDTLHILLSD